MTARSCTFEVLGIPAPQGSKRHVGHGVMIESSKKVKPWRDAVAWSARNLLLAVKGGCPLDGPLRATLIFTLARPFSAPNGRTHPDRKPDLDKLIRSTLDAITDSGLIADDARIVELRASKVYGAPSGASIAITEMT